MRYYTAKVETLDSTTQLDFSHTQMSTPTARSRSQRLSVCLSVCLSVAGALARAVDNTDKERAQCVLWFAEQLN